MAKKTKWARILLNISAMLLLVIGATVVFGSWLYVRQQGVENWKDLATRGQYGDSFGVLGALFAGLALLAAATAAFLQWTALREERAANSSGAVESRFFHLVESLQNAVNTTRNGTYVGRQAMRKVAELAIKLAREKRTSLGKGPNLPEGERKADINKWFLEFYHGEYDEEGTEHRYRAGDLLGHLFRLTYHIVKYVNEAEAADAEDKLFYVRILRAHLSNPELVLLMYNAIADYGKEKMFKLIEHHDLLQNIDLSSLPDVDDALLLKTLRPKVAEYKAKLAQQQSS